MFDLTNNLNKHQIEEILNLIFCVLNFKEKIFKIGNAVDCKKLLKESAQLHK